jgi:hypothetical protein
MKKPLKPIDDSLLVALYREGKSLRAIAAEAGVHWTTVAKRLEVMGEPRRGTHEGNQRRYPRLGRFCAMCGNAFTIRQGHLARGASRGGTCSDLGLFCSHRCWAWDQRRRALEDARNTIIVEIEYV